MSCSVACRDFSQREVGHFGTPSLITRTTNDVQQVQMLALMSFTLMVSAPIIGVGAIILALNQNVPLSSLLLILVPLLAVIVVLIVSRMRPLFRLMQVRIDRINQVLREQITGVRVIRAFVRDDFERGRFAATNDDLFSVGLGVGRLMAFMFPSVMLVVQLASVATLWFGGHLINDGSMKIGALTAFLSYLVQVLMAVMMATFMFVMVPRAEACAERIEEVLDTTPSVVPAANPISVSGVRGHLEMHGVEFRYPGAEEPVLKGVDLIANPGEVTAIIGSTGSGKTTLVNLVPRLFDATAGSVTIDGIDVREVAEDALAGVIGLVPQRAYLFSGTVASNLRYGNPDATDEELWRALEIAQARPFVEAMSDGIDSPIAQGGSNVSGGQRQRLAIARAIVLRPRVYLFDDAFSALDYATDAALRAALSAETADATMVIIAQRVSTIRQANRIVVLDSGRVAGVGTHAELMAGNATYREIVLSQLTEEEAA
jgi:ATP-binding cassette subfamily B multidrug efflux pump